MILPGVKDVHPRSLLKRKQPSPSSGPSAKRQLDPLQLHLQTADMVPDVCSYETISDYIQLFGDQEGEGGSPASLESGYHTPNHSLQDQDDEDSNLSWLLNFKVSSLFDPTEDRPPPPKEDACMCAGQGHKTAAGKPPFTYTELIEKALREQGQLTVSGIYTWISTKFPFYNPSDDRWKNSVRHNLSINPHFRKGLKSRHGAGHLWTLSNEGVNPPPESWKRCRLTAGAARSPSPMTAKMTAAVVDEVALAAASIMPELDPEEPEPALHRTAEEILSGVKRRVEVQYLVHDHNTNEFLNPVSKEELVTESGLDSSPCEATSSLLSDLNSDLHLPDNLFTDDLAFTCYSHL